METVPKYSTLNIFGRDWREVVSEVSGRLTMEYIERYSLADTVEELTFVFLCVTSYQTPPFCVYLMTVVLEEILPLLCPHLPPLPPRPPLPHPHMYTGTSVIGTQTVIVCPNP